MTTATLTAAATSHRTVIAKSVDQSRLRTRYLSDSEIQSVIDDVRQAALDNHAWSHDCTHAGDVANAYNYPASTTGLLAVSDPDGNVVAWLCRLPANKVTLSGVCSHTVPSAAPLYDGRYGREARLAAEVALQAAHAEAMSCE